MSSEIGGHKCEICGFAYFGKGSKALKAQCMLLTLRNPRYKNEGIVTRREYRKRDDPPKYRVRKIEITHGEKQTLDRKSVVSHVYQYTIDLISNTNIVHELFEEKLFPIK